MDPVAGFRKGCQVLQADPLARQVVDHLEGAFDRRRQERGALCIKILDWD